MGDSTVLLVTVRMYAIRYGNTRTPDVRCHDPRITSRRAWILLLAAAWISVPPAGVMAQGRDRSWGARVRVAGEVLFDDNVYLLTDAQKARLAGGVAADAISGRFRDMEDARDFVASSHLELGAAGPGLGGRTLAIQAATTYEANIANARRRHAVFRADVEQALRREGQVRVRVDWRPSYFHKNYLADAIDVSANGSIEAQERVYSAGTSHEIEGSMRYRRRLVKATKRHPFGLSGEVRAGYFGREYDAPFEGHSRRGPALGVNVAADLGSGWTAGLGYAYAREEATPTREVLLLDETAFGRDFNSNGSIDDIAARAFELVDRSRAEHGLEATLGVAFGGGAKAELQYDWRHRIFSSTEPYDVTNRARRDSRHTVRFTLDVRLARRLRLALGGALARQNTNRSGDPAATGDITDYARHTGRAELSYRF